MFQNTDWQQWPLNPPDYKNVPPPQQKQQHKDVDWGSLAQKWTQMRKTTDSSSTSNSKPNNNVPPKKDPPAAENLKMSNSELEDLSTGRMSNYPVLPPPYISFDPLSRFGVASQRSKELDSKKEVSVISSSESDADNSNNKDPNLVRKRPNSLCDTYPNKLPCLSDSAKSKLTRVQKDAARNYILIEKYKLQNNETIEMICQFESALKSKSNCEIKFLNDRRYFTLSGTREAIDLAKELIQMIIEKIHLVSGMKTMDVLEQQIEMIIPGNKVSSVIGPKGSTVKLLSEKTGCKIIIVADSFSYKIDRKLRITGESANCRRAQELIESWIKCKSSGEQIKIDLKLEVGSSHTGQFNQDKYQEAIFYVPTKAIGMIIGSKGKMISHLKNVTGLSNLRISTDILPDTSKRHLVMCGTPQEIYWAKQFIQGKIKEYQVKTGDFSPELTRQANNLEVASYPWLNGFLGPVVATNDSKNPVSTTPLEVASYPWLNSSLGTKAATNKSKKSLISSPVELVSYPWLNNSLATKAATNNSKDPVPTSSLQQSYLSVLSLIGEQSSQEDNLASIPDSVESAEQFASQDSRAIPYSNSSAERLRSPMVYYDNIQAGKYQKPHMVHQNFVAGESNRTSMSEYQQSRALQNVAPVTSESQPAEQNWHWQLPLSSKQYLQMEKYQQPSMIQNKHVLPRQNY